MERLEKPYKSNCTRYWTKTNYSEFVDDPDERHYNGRRNQIKYSTAVIIFKETRHKRYFFIVLKLCYIFIVYFP